MRAKPASAARAVTSHSLTTRCASCFCCFLHSKHARAVKSMLCSPGCCCILWISPVSRAACAASLFGAACVRGRAIVPQQLHACVYSRYASVSVLLASIFESVSWTFSSRAFACVERPGLPRAFAPPCLGEALKSRHACGCAALFEQVYLDALSLFAVAITGCYTVVLTAALEVLCRPNLRDTLALADPRWFDTTCCRQLRTLAADARRWNQFASIPELSALHKYVLSFVAALSYYLQHAQFQQHGRVETAAEVAMRGAAPQTEPTTASLPTTP